MLKPIGAVLMSNQFRFASLGVLALIAVGCAPAPDKPNLSPVTAAKDPVAIKALSDIKAIPDPAARRAWVASHQSEVQALHNDPGAWTEASKLMWGEVKPSSMDDSQKKGK